MANPTPAQLHAYIAAGLGCDHLDVQGDGQHFYATIVSPEFEGLSRVHRHQRVYAALGERMQRPLLRFGDVQGIVREIEARNRASGRRSAGGAGLNRLSNRGSEPVRPGPHAQSRT